MAGQRGARPSFRMPEPFGSCLLVSGPESLVADRWVAQRVAAALQQRPEAEVTRVAALDLEGNRLAELVGGSLFSSASVVVIQDLANLPPELFDAVLASAVDPGQDLSLTLVHGGGQKGKGLLDKLKKAKVPVAEAVAPKTWELPGWVSTEARRISVGLDTEAAQALVDAVGSDLRALAGAVSQLGSDWEGQTVTAQMVARYFAGRAEVTGFAVADDILAGRPGPALEKLRWALSTGIAPVQVTSAVAASLRGLGKYLDARSARMPDGELAREVGVPPWKLKDLARLSRTWSGRGVSEALRAVATADAQVKGAASDPDFALEQLLLAVDRAHALGKH
ncbi:MULTISPECIES: DNA polymerase III subunit delta [unclassified Luteococcus]|uniref:DNA polymerase III subunit delta n=1 Tax=unclassified Luteococcus TaxID=2639923 RepID=UPI00313E07DF